MEGDGKARERTAYLGGGLRVVVVGFWKDRDGAVSPRWVADHSALAATAVSSICPGFNGALHHEGNKHVVRAVVCTVRTRCAWYLGVFHQCTVFFSLVTVDCKHRSPTSISTASGRAAGSKICHHPPPSARGGTPRDRRP